MACVFKPRINVQFNRPGNLKGVAGFKKQTGLYPCKCRCKSPISSTFSFNRLSNSNIKSQCWNVSRISNQFRKIEFWFIPPKQPFGMVISEIDIKKTPSALNLDNFRRVRKFTKQRNTIFIHEISHNFERFQRNSTGAKDLLLT